MTAVTQLVSFLRQFPGVHGFGLKSPLHLCNYHCALPRRQSEARPRSWQNGRASTSRCRKAVIIVPAAKSTPQVDPSAARLRSVAGGYAKAAYAPNRDSLTRAARDARMERFRERIREALPHIDDPAEIDRRAQLLLKSEMSKLSLKAAQGRRRAAQARREASEAEAELADLAEATS